VERDGLAAGPAVVTAAEMVAGHVSLDVSCLDRVYLEFQLVWTARKRATDPGACPQFSFTKGAAAGLGVLRVHLR